MNKAKFFSIIVFFIFLYLAISCGPSLPPPEESVIVVRPKDEIVSVDVMNDLLSKHEVEIPIIQPQANSVIHAIVLPVDIDFLESEQVNYFKVILTINILEMDETPSQETNKIDIITGIPKKIDRAVSVEEAFKVGASIEAVASELFGETNITGNVKSEVSKEESYSRFYRQVTTNSRSDNSLRWTFKPFKDEPIFPGTYYTIALVEVKEPARKFLVQVEASCTYGTSGWLGLFPNEQECLPHKEEFLLVQSEPLSTNDQMDSTTPGVIETELPPSQPPAAEILLVYGGN